MRLLRAHTASQAALWPERPYAPLFFIGALPQNTPELHFTAYAKFIWVPLKTTVYTKLIWGSAPPPAMERTIDSTFL